jgi:hypothetical protein
MQRIGEIARHDFQDAGHSHNTIRRQYIQLMDTLQQQAAFTVDANCNAGSGRETENGHASLRRGQHENGKENLAQPVLNA